MIKVSELRQYKNELVAELALVKSAHVVIDQEEVVLHLNDKKSADNQIMIVVMPEARSNGDEDNLKMNNFLAFLFLEYTEYKASREEQWIDVFERTQESAIAFRDKLLKDKADKPCTWMGFINEAGINMEPVKNLASCNGWIVEINYNIPL